MEKILIIKLIILLIKNYCDTAVAADDKENYKFKYCGYYVKYMVKNFLNFCIVHDTCCTW